MYALKTTSQEHQLPRRVIYSGKEVVIINYPLTSHILHGSVVMRLSVLSAVPRRHHCRPLPHHFLVFLPSRRCPCMHVWRWADLPCTHTVDNNVNSPANYLAYRLARHHPLHTDVLATDDQQSA